MQEELQARQDAQTSARVAQQQQQMAARVASETHKKTVQNPNYQEAIESPGFDDTEFEDVPADFAAWLNGARTRGNMGDHWSEFSEIKNRNERDRRKIERTPGNLVAGDPYLLAVEQGVGRDPTNPARPDSNRLRQRFNSRQRRVVDTTSTVATMLDSLSKQARGIDATSTVKTESQVQTNEDDKTDGVAESMSGKIFG